MKSVLPFSIMVRGDGTAKSFKADLATSPFLFHTGGHQLAAEFKPESASAIVNPTCSGYEISATLADGVIEFTFDKSLFDVDKPEEAPEDGAELWINGKLQF